MMPRLTIVTHSISPDYGWIGDEFLGGYFFEQRNPLATLVADATDPPAFTIQEAREQLRSAP